MPTRFDPLPATAEAHDRFKPRPYLQFARALRAAGLDWEADKVLIRLEQNRTRYDRYSRFLKCLRYLFLERLLMYGLEWGLLRPAIVLAIWAVFGSFVFEIASYQEHIKPTWHNREELTLLPDKTHPHIKFNALVFAIDTAESLGAE